MDVTWLKDYADFIMLGIGISIGFGMAIFKVMRFVQERRNGPLESAAATRHDIKSLHTALSGHAEETKAGFMAMDRKFENLEETTDAMNEQITQTRSDIRSVGERTDRLESRTREVERKSDGNAVDISRIEGHIGAKS